MITVEEAKELLFSKIEKSEIVSIDIAEAYGNVLADDILSPVDMPLFDQSSVDGYAINYQLSKIIDRSQSFQIAGEIKAGDTVEFDLKYGQCARIFTGAIVPSKTSLIVMQEFVTVSNNFMSLNADFKPGNFVRKQGSQIKKGELALEKGLFLNPGAIGFIASMGLAKVKVYKVPKISIIVTGDEIEKPGKDLQHGQIYESNSYALQAALRQQHIEPEYILNAKDTVEDHKKQFGKAIKDSDIVLLTGGISVGDYDLVYNTLMNAGAETLFYKVAQRPGKPLWAGKIGNKLIFALPGNPASVMACFYEYVYPAIRKMRGFANAEMTTLKLKLLKEINEPGPRAAFIRSKITAAGVLPLDKQDSGMMMSFAGGNALIYVPKDKNYVAENEMVEVHLLPFDN